MIGVSEVIGTHDNCSQVKHFSFIQHATTYGSSESRFHCLKIKKYKAFTNNLQSSACSLNA